MSKTSFLRGIDDTVAVKCMAEIYSAKGTQRVPFTAHFDRLTVDQIKECGRMFERDDHEQVNAMIKKHLRDITDLELKDGSKATFSAELVDEMLQFTEYRNALGTGFAESTIGRPLTEKN